MTRSKCDTSSCLGLFLVAMIFTAKGTAQETARQPASVLAAAKVSSAKVTLLHSFGGSDIAGQDPSGSLLTLDGTLYGMTGFGSANGGGAIFKINSDGSGFAVLHSFAGGIADGHIPVGSLTPYGGTLYGVTSLGGPNLDGIVFKINRDGSGFAILHSFIGDCINRSSPVGPLTFSRGMLYGVTEGGGARGLGTVFKISPDGANFAILHSFSYGENDGVLVNGPLLALDGVLYGTTPSGGSSGRGTVFRINVDGTGFALLHTFLSAFRPDETSSAYAASPDDGSDPSGSLAVFGGVLYGVTQFGGEEGEGTIFKINPDGSGFALLHSFGAGHDSDISLPSGPLVERGGVFYGVTAFGAYNAFGAIYRVNPDGSDFAIVHSFCGGPADGALAHSPLTVLAGSLYGVTRRGGSGGWGTVFRLELPDHITAEHLTPP